MLLIAIFITVLCIVLFIAYVQRTAKEKSRFISFQRYAAHGEGSKRCRSTLFFFRYALSWANSMAHSDGAKDTTARSGGRTKWKTGTFSMAANAAKRGITHSPARTASNVQNKIKIQRIKTTKQKEYRVCQLSQKIQVVVILSLRR